MKLQITLRRILLLVAFIAAALGCFRACVTADDASAIFFAILGLFFVGSAAGILCEQPLFAGLFFLMVLYLIASFLLLMGGILAEIFEVFR